MKIGICIPYMKAGVTRQDYLDWFKRIDDGPFHSLSCGERVNGPTYNMGSLLAAAAVATQRVEINATLYVLPMHSAVRVAKEIATIDVLSGGRVNRVTVGYGGREQDYQAMGANFIGRYGRMDRQIEIMRRVWAQEIVVEGGEPIGPPPMTIKCRGRSVNEKTDSLVRYPASSIPGMDGCTARAPVAMTAFRKTSSSPPTRMRSR